MKLKPIKWTPVVLTLIVLLVICAVRLGSQRLPPNWDLCDRLERMTYDLRARAALKFPEPVATNLAFVAMADSSIKAIRYDDFLKYYYGLYWPRDIYGHLIQELSAQGAKAVAFDVIFGERNAASQSMVPLPDGSYVEPDEFLALKSHAAGNVLIGATTGVTPPPLFATNVLALGDVFTDKDPDGTLRRVKAFQWVREWHWILRKIAADPEIQWDLSQATVTPGILRLPKIGATNFTELPIDAQTNFQPGDLLDTVPPGVPAKVLAFTNKPLWHLGIQLAAQELKLDLAHAVIDLPHGRITLPGAGGIERTIPVDADGYFYVDWRLAFDDPRVIKQPIESLLTQDKLRQSGQTNGLSDDFRGKLVVVGSTATGNDLTDRGATPLENDTFLPSTYWNVANSVITGQFIRRTSVAVDLSIICLIGLLVAWLTWAMRRRIIYASLTVVGIIIGYLALSVFAFVAHRWWLPVFYPVAGAMLMQHGMMVIYLVIVEGQEKRHIKSIFSKIVAPDVVNELLDAEHFSMVGSRREVTVLFADVRGFTTLTDEMQEAVEEYVRQNKLEGEAAEKCYDESARETLETVNMYLTKVADAVIAHGGTLDKYIGDCVMAFWGAPLDNEKHALGCVRAALDAQRSISDLNKARLAENVTREAENAERLTAGLPAKAPLRALQLGTGINTGTVIVGLMGSGEHISNYTIFGREVNLASRLEGVSGSGRIIISEITLRHLQKHEPALAATCVELESVHVKGIRTAVRIFEVPWRRPDDPPAIAIPKTH